MNAPALRSPRKPKGHGAERREEILAAALKLFTEFGVYGVSTRQIADAVGISQPTLYAYFPNKDEIGRELHTRAFQLLADHLAKAKEEPVETVADLSRLLRIYVDFGLENPEMYRIAFMEGAGSTKAWMKTPDIALAPAVQSTFGVLLSKITELHGRGLTVNVDPMLMTQSVWAAKHGLVSLLLAKPGFPWADRETLIRSHMDVIVRGIWRA